MISDGGDNASETTFEQILAKVQASNVVIHAVGVVDPIDPDSNLKRLRQLAEASGGTVFRPGDSHQVRDAIERVALDIRSAYTVGYAPVDTTTGGFRRIRAGVRAPSVKGMSSNPLPEYIAPPHGSHPHAE